MITKKTILVTILPSYSHYYPMLPLLTELKELGFEICVASAAVMQDLTRNHGFKFFSVGFNWLESEICDLLPDFGLMTSVVKIKVLRDLFWRDYPESSLPDLFKIVKEVEPNLILSSSHEISGMILAKAVGLPLVLHVNELNISVELEDQILRTYLANLEKKFILTENSRYISEPLRLCFTPPVLSVNYTRKHANQYFFKPNFFFPKDTYTKAVNFDQCLNHLPLIFCSLGNTFSNNAILEILTDALSQCSIRAVFSCSEAYEKSHRTYKNIVFIQNVNFENILSEASLCIHHGGINTTLACVNKGVPMIILPLIGDQSHNSFCCEALGSAVTLKENLYDEFHYIKIELLTVEDIICAIDQVFKNPKYKEASLLIHEEIENLQNPSFAAEMIRIHLQFDRRLAD